MNPKLTPLFAPEIKYRLFKAPALQDLFIRNGFVVVDFLLEEEVAALKQFYSSEPGDLGQPAFASTIMSRDIPYRRRVSAIIEAIFQRPLQALCPEAQLFWGNFNCKYLQLGRVPLHQDPSFLDERRHYALNIWVPLIDTTPDNGALQVIPGSHTLLKGPRYGGYPFPYVSLQQELLHRFGKTLPMRAGQAYIGNLALFHASAGNTSNEVRIAAAGLAGHTESALRYFHRTQLNGTGYAEMFAVDRDYFITQPLFSRPSADRYSLLETIQLEESFPAPEMIFDMLRSFNNSDL